MIAAGLVVAACIAGGFALSPPPVHVLLAAPKAFLRIDRGIMDWESGPHLASMPRRSICIRNNTDDSLIAWAGERLLGSIDPGMTHRYELDDTNVEARGRDGSGNGRSEERAGHLATDELELVVVALSSKGAARGSRILIRRSAIRSPVLLAWGPSAAPTLPPDPLAGATWGSTAPEPRAIEAAAELRRKSAGDVPMTEAGVFRTADLDAEHGFTVFPPFTTKTRNSIGMEFVLIPPGRFTMGQAPGPETYKTEVAHQVTLTRPFLLGTTEVTQAQWVKVMGSNPSAFVRDERPVETITHADATEFCERLSRLEGNRYRLPT